MSLRPSLLALLTLALAAGARSAPAPVVSARTPRGSLLLLQPDRTAPRIAISLVLRAGAADETVASAGWRRLLVDSMLQSTHDPSSSASSSASGSAQAFLSGARLRDRIEALGGRMTAQVGDDAIELSMTGPSARAPELLEILMAIATQPRLSDEDIDRARRALVRRLSDEPDAAGPDAAGPDAPGVPNAPGTSASAGGSALDASARALRRLEERLYRDAGGNALAYALAPAGTLQSLSNLDSAQLRSLFSQYFAPARRVLSLAGDVDEAGLSAKAAQLEAGGQWGIAPDSRPDFAPVPAGAPPLDVSQGALVVRSDSPAAAVFLSYPVEFEALSAKESAALQVLAAALGESPRARLPRRLSDARRAFGNRQLDPGSAGSANVAFAPSLTAQWVPRRLRGEFVLWAQTGPQQIEAVKNALLDEMSKIRNAPLSPAELQAAKNFARGAYFTDRELLRERASRNALDAARAPGSARASSSVPGKPWISQVEGLSAREVQQAARKYLKAYAVALVMPVD